MWYLLTVKSDMATPSTSTDGLTGYRKIFMETLLEETIADLSEWVYAGGDRDSHLNWFQLNYKPEQQPAHEGTCICSHPIEQNCYIYNKTTGVFLVVGNCCINKVRSGTFVPANCFAYRSGEIGGDTSLSLSRQCKHCNSETANRKDPYCDTCRGGILKFGKHAGQSYRWIAENDLPYCQWYMSSIILSFLKFSEQPGFYNDEFADFLIAQKYCPAPQYDLEEMGETGVVSVGKYKGKTYSQLLTADLNYCKWICSTSTFSDQRLQYWLRNQFPEFFGYINDVCPKCGLTTSKSTVINDGMCGRCLPDV